MAAKAASERPQHLEMRDRKIEIVTAVVQLREIGIAHRIVDELMMREMMQAEMERRGIDRKRRKPIRHQLVEYLVLK